MNEFLAFLGIAAILIVTPGQDMALVLRNTLRGGFRNGFLTAVGVVSGQGIWALTVAFGIATVLLAAEPVFHAIKLAGAAYLCWLGIQALRSALRPDPPADVARDEQPARLVASSTLLRQGILSSLGNPKLALFFTSFLPQFVPHDADPRLALLTLGVVFGLLTLGWLTLYVAALARAGDILHRRQVRRALDGLTGAVLIGLGARLATQHR